MFNPLGVDRGVGFVDSDRQQEPVHDLVTLATPRSQSPSLDRQQDRLIRLGRQQAFSLQPRHDPVDRYVTDAEPLGQIGHPTRLLLAQQVRDRLHIILRRFRGVVATGSAVWLRFAGG